MHLQLNSYFEQLQRVIASQGGDVFKFAGDALLVLWPSSDEDLPTVTPRAAQSALEIQKKMQEQMARIKGLGPDVMGAVMEQMDNLEPDEDMPGWME